MDCQSTYLVHDERFNHANFANLPIRFVYEALSEAVEKKCDDINALNYTTSWAVYFIQAFMGGSKETKHSDFLPYAHNREKTLVDSMNQSTIQTLYELWRKEEIPMKILNALNANGIFVNKFAPETDAFS